MSRSEGRSRFLLAFAALLLLVVPARGQQPEKSETKPEAQSRDTEPDPPVAPAGASPGSLWTGMVSDVDWVSDLRARRVGDVVTIRIVESVQARQGADTESERDTNISGGIDFLFGLQNYAPEQLELDQLIGASSSTRFSGGGQNSRTNSLNTTITATVREVLPNGNFLIEASRQVKVNEEEERLTLRGTIRRFDIGPRNVVLSTAVSDIEIEYGGKGVIGSNLKPGILFRLIRYIF